MFKQLITASVLLISSSFICADDRLSCDELNDLANELEGLAAAFESAETIREGDQVDSALADVVDALFMVARVENDNGLNNSATDLEYGWQKMDADVFVTALDNTIADLDRLLRRDCQ